MSAIAISTLLVHVLATVAMFIGTAVASILPNRH